MKKIILQPAKTEITVAELEGDENVAYRSRDSGNLRILTRLTPSKTNGPQLYGFTPLGYIGEPTFIGNTPKQAIEKAAVARTCYVYESIEELLNLPK